MPRVFIARDDPPVFVDWLDKPELLNCWLVDHGIVEDRRGDYYLMYTMEDE